jgi:hypothetical protein
MEMTMYEQMEHKLADLHGTVVAELHTRITAAVARSVQERGISERDAFRSHMKQLAQQHPKCFIVYFRWLAETAN